MDQDDADNEGFTNPEAISGSIIDCRGDCTGEEVPGGGAGEMITNMGKGRAREASHAFIAGTPLPRSKAIVMSYN